jgi:hypothetical protein
LFQEGYTLTRGERGWGCPTSNEGSDSVVLQVYFVTNILSKDKVQSIIKVKEKHKQKVADLLDAVDRLEREIEAAKHERSKLGGGGGGDSYKSESHSRGKSGKSNRSLSSLDSQGFGP